MARLFHEVAGADLAPLGIAPALFPLLVELWFGTGPVSRESLRTSLEMGGAEVDALVTAMAAAGLIERAPDDIGKAIVLTALGASLRNPAMAAARRANAAAAAALSEEELVTFVTMMNRVIDSLQKVQGKEGARTRRRS